MWNTVGWPSAWGCPAISGFRRRTATLISSPRSPDLYAAPGSAALAFAVTLARVCARSTSRDALYGVTVYIGRMKNTASNEKLSRISAPSLRLVIFDCDGVLIDSEPVVNRVIAAELTHLGWPMTPDEAYQRFLGLDLNATVPLIQATLGHPLPMGWLDRITARIIDGLHTDAPMVPGAREALNAVDAMGLPWRVASNSSHAEMRAKFAANGLLEVVEGRLHSYTDVPQGKPAPDLFLAAAQAQRVPPAACLVVEDSVPGVTGATAAGMRCLGLARHGDGRGLAAAGATVFNDMHALPDLLYRYAA